MDSRQRDRSLCGFRPGAFVATITVGIVLAGALQTSAARGQGDAAVAALLAGAAASAAGHLVEVNLATVPEDERAARGEVFASKAASAARRAVSTAASA